MRYENFVVMAPTSGCAPKGTILYHSDRWYCHKNQMVVPRESIQGLQESCVLLRGSIVVAQESIFMALVTLSAFLPTTHALSQGRVVGAPKITRLRSYTSSGLFGFAAIRIAKTSFFPFSGAIAFSFARFFWVGKHGFARFS